MTAVENIHETSHEAEALGLSKALSKWKTTAAIFLLDYTLPQVAKLSKTLQIEHLDLSIIPSLVDATLHTLSDAVLPAANWVLEVFGEHEHLEQVIGKEITNEDIAYFQEMLAKPFITHLRNKFSSRCVSSGDILLH